MLSYDAYEKYQIFLEKNNFETAYENINESEILDKSKLNSQDSKADQLMSLAKEDVGRCVALIMARFKFFAEFIYRFRILYTYRVDTMATDGKNIFINPKFVSELTDEEITFILCHEVLHNVLCHFKRMDNINAEPTKWNYAADYELNPLLVDEGLLDANHVKNKLKACYDEKYLGMTAEEIYDILPQQKSDDDKGKNVPVEIGDAIKTKDGKYGQITGINADGSYEVRECTFEEAKKIVDAA